MHRCCTNNLAYTCTCNWSPYNTLRPRQSGRHFPDDISKCIFLNKNVWIPLKNLFLGFDLTIFQHWFRSWLNADQATSYYLNQWWLLYWRIYTSLNLNEMRSSRIMKRFPIENYLFSRSVASSFRVPLWVDNCLLYTCSLRVYNKKVNVALSLCARVMLYHPFPLQWCHMGITIS